MIVIKNYKREKFRQIIHLVSCFQFQAKYERILAEILKNFYSSIKSCAKTRSYFVWNRKQMKYLAKLFTRVAY